MHKKQENRQYLGGGDADGHITSLLTFADREAINQIPFALLFQFIEFREKVSQFNKGFIKSIAKNFTPDFQFDPYNNPAKKHYTFETREEILGEIAGDVVSSAAGAAMFFGGASAASGGSAAAALTGIGITITPAVAATGATVAIYGGATAFHAGQNLVEDISRFKASTSGNGSATPPKLDTAESAVEKLDVPGISRFIRTEKGIVEVSKTTFKHINNRHSAEKFREEIPHLTDDEIKVKLADRSFFNPNWSETKINEIVTKAYNELRSQGKKGGQFEYDIDGEKIMLVIGSKGELNTAYGLHKLTIDFFK